MRMITLHLLLRSGATHHTRPPRLRGGNPIRASSKSSWRGLCARKNEKRGKGSSNSARINLIRERGRRGFQTRIQLAQVLFHETLAFANKGTSAAAPFLLRQGSLSQQPVRHTVPALPTRFFAQQPLLGLTLPCVSSPESLRNPGNIEFARQPVASPRGSEQPPVAFFQGGVYGNVNPGARINSIARNKPSPRTATNNLASPFRVVDGGPNMIHKQTVEALVDLKRIDRSILSKIRQGHRGPRNYQPKKKAKAGIPRNIPSPPSTNSPDLAPCPRQSPRPRTPHMTSSRIRHDTAPALAQNTMASWENGGRGVVPWNWQAIEPIGRDPLIDFHLKDLDIHDDTDELEVINKTMSRLCTLLQAKLAAYPPEDTSAGESVIDVMRECFGEVKKAVVELGHVPYTPVKHEIRQQVAPRTMNVELANALMCIIGDDDEDNGSIADASDGERKLREQPVRDADGQRALGIARGIINQLDGNISAHSSDTRGLSSAELEDLVTKGSQRETSRWISAPASEMSTSGIPQVASGLSEAFRAELGGFSQGEEETRGSQSVHWSAETYSAHSPKLPPRTVSIREEVSATGTLYSTSEYEDDAAESREKAFSPLSSGGTDNDFSHPLSRDWHPTNPSALQEKRISRVFGRSMTGALPARSYVSALQSSIGSNPIKKDANILPKRAQSTGFMVLGPAFLSPPRKEPFDILSPRTVLAKLEEERLMAYLHARPLQGDMLADQLEEVIESMKSDLEHAAFDLDAFDDARLLCELEYEKGRLRGPNVPPDADLLIAVQYNAKSIVKYMIGQKANLSACDSSGKTALNIAVENGYYGLLLVLHSANAPQNYVTYKAKKPAQMPAIIESMQSLDDIGELNFALFDAALIAREDVCDYLLSLSADANAELNGDSVLYVASLNRRGHRTIELLLTRGANYPPTVGNKEARRWASRVSLSTAELGDGAERVQAFMANN
eukprot:GEMP01005597.1.p1 GENE.GEMP01005597.1~~GEMP01005597.1.p1  ORF type:complete len:958 (+),score=257.46 GEMP01005597.1:442-3315(+)